MNYLKTPLFFILFLFAATTTFGQRVVFNIKSTPDHANIYLNNELIGKTPLNQLVKLDFKKFFKYDLRIELDGYVPANYEITSAGTVNINAQLNYKPVLQDVSTEVIAFDKMVFDIKEGAEIGEAYNHTKIYWEAGNTVATVEFNKLVEDQLSSLGYNIFKQNVLFADVDNQKQPTLLLGATLKKLYLRQTITVSRNEYSCDMDIEWKLLNRRQNKIIGTFNTKGQKTVQGQVISKAVHEGFAIALFNLARDSAFIKTVLNASTKVTGSGASKEIQLPKIKPVRYNASAQMINSALQSVVTVKHDGGHGSGFLISESGYIITNWHVIEGQNEINVIFNNGLSLPAQVYSYDEEYDVAILKIPGSGYKPLTIGNSDSALIGSDLIAIGTPRETSLGQTVTKGILSGKRMYEDRLFIQTDVSVHPGNSGGPLLDQTGSVIGIITYKYKDAEGLNFAIPINVAIERLKITFK